MTTLVMILEYSVGLIVALAPIYIVLFVAGHAWAMGKLAATEHFTRRHMAGRDINAKGT